MPIHIRLHRNPDSNFVHCFFRILKINRNLCLSIYNDSSRVVICDSHDEVSIVVVVIWVDISSPVRVPIVQCG